MRRGFVCPNSGCFCLVLLSQLHQETLSTKRLQLDFSIVFLRLKHCMGLKKALCPLRGMPSAQACNMTAVCWPRVELHLWRLCKASAFLCPGLCKPGGVGCTLTEGYQKDTPGGSTRIFLCAGFQVLYCGFWGSFVRQC